MKNEGIKYCVLICTELARADHDYFEKPHFFDTLEDAKAYAREAVAEIMEYPANADAFIFRSL